MQRWTAHMARLAAVALALAAASTSFGQNSVPSVADEAPDPDSALISFLHATVVDVDYKSVDFDEVIEDLRARWDLNIHVSWRKLEDRGLRRDHRLEIRLSGISLSTLLETILREVSSRTTEVAFHVEGGVLIISTREDLARKTILRTYDITDLIDSGYAIRRFANTPVLSMNLTGREFIGGEKREHGGGGGFGGGAGGGGNVFGNPGSDPDPMSEMQRIELIIHLVMENVDPDSWIEHGGDTGSLHVVNSVLLIQHTITGHRKIEAFLRLLRTTQPRPLDADVLILRLHPDESAAWRSSFGSDFPRLPSDAADELMTDEQTEDVLFRAVTSGHNGQRIWFSALTQRDVLTGMAPFVAAQSNAFAPLTGFCTEGLELVALPLIAPGSDEMLLDVQMAWVPTARITQRPVTLASGEAVASIDQATRSMRTVSTAVRLKIGQAIALAIPAQLDDAGQAAQWEDWLVIRVREPGT